MNFFSLFGHVIYDWNRKKYVKYMEKYIRHKENFFVCESNSLKKIVAPTYSTRFVTSKNVRNVVRIFSHNPGELCCEYPIAL